MPKRKNDSAPAPAKPGMPESITITAEAVATRDVTGTESQVSFTTSASDYTEAAATDANPSPANPGTAEPTSPHDDTSEAGPTKDEAGAANQIPAAPSNASKNNPLPAAEGVVTQPAETDDDCWVEPFIPYIPPRAPEPVPEPKQSSLVTILDDFLRSRGIDPTLTLSATETESPAAAADGSSSDTEIAKPGEILKASVQTPLPPSRFATAVELILWIMLCLLAEAHLPEDVAALAAFFVISTFFQDVLRVFPCLLITGPAHDAHRVLQILERFCRQAALLVGFRRSDLAALRAHGTLLISEPNLDKRTANLLSGLTDRKFSVVLGSSLDSYSRSIAIYAGENPETHKIENAIRIHISPTNAAPPDDPKWLDARIDRLRAHLDLYRDENLSYVRQSTWLPFGLSSETAAIAAPLGSCIVDTPELRQVLVSLLKTHDQQRQFEKSNTIEAIVLEATRTLCCEGQKESYARDIALQANFLQAGNGDTLRLSAEKVGHVLKRIGLPTCKLSQAGNGLRFDKTTLAQLKQLFAVYGVEDTPEEIENLLCQQTTENKQVE